LLEERRKLLFLASFLKEDHRPLEEEKAESRQDQDVEPRVQQTSPGQ
jgi:hypothetical protein